MGKRTFDILIGTVLGLLALPVIMVLALASALLLRSWPFFYQDRIGHLGRSFRVLKIRTLPSCTPHYMLKAELGQLQGSIPRFLLFLRHHHIDEIPQLLLVPLGRLSLVGPRPKMPDTVEPVDPAYSHARLAVPQGCTGLWQIGPDTHDLPQASPQYDYFYLRYGTLRLDAWILWRTFLLMSRLGGPVGLHQVPSWALRGRVSPALLPGAETAQLAAAMPRVEAA